MRRNRRSAIAYVSTGQVDEVDAHDEPAAAAIALSARDDAAGRRQVSYNPAQELYGVAGEDEAVRVSSRLSERGVTPSSCRVDRGQTVEARTSVLLRSM